MPPTAANRRAGHSGATRPARPAADAGFALVVTISLMVLISVIAVGLLGLAAIVLREGRASDDMATARANARLALLLAIGELQRHAGPDQRVTATADIAGKADGLPVASGEAPANNTTVTGSNKGLGAVQDGTRHWTGVWANSSSSPTQVYTRTPAPVLVQWLVSGNHGAFAADASFTPASPTAALRPDGTADPEHAALLVGPNTVGSANPGRYVTAPLLAIRPAGTGALPSGRWAWWVGDEGVKARINLAATETDGTRYTALVAQRRGWETVDGFADYPLPQDSLHDLLPRLATVPETSLLVPGTGDAGAGTTPLQAAFHSATADSMGVLADCLSGGTRIDLSAILAADLPSSNPLPEVVNYPLRNGNLVPRTVCRTMRAPKWDALRDFHDRGAGLESGALVVKAAATAYDPSVAPLITDFRVLMGVRFVAVNAAFKANACGKIAIAVANPYSVPLRWERDLEIEVRNQTPAGNLPSRIFNLGTNSVYLPSNAGEQAVFNNVVFRIKSATLAPGEARAYTLGGAALRPPGSGTRRLVVDLAPFRSAGAGSFANCVELDTTTTYATFPALDVRESWQTTLMMVEMRLAGSSSSGQPLRRIERFELDNGYYATNIRDFRPEECRRLTQPVPLMLYSFQVSQPGVDYRSLMPNGYEAGQRSSTLRTFADFNLQATRVSKPITSYNPPPYFMESNNSWSQLPFNPPGGDTGLGFTRNLALDPLPWGRSPSGARRTVLFSVPSRLVSLAQFQHADLTGDDVAASIGHQPGNAFGNSYATPFVKRSLTYQNRVDYELMGSNNPSGATRMPRTYYDVSYLLNAALWDGFFLSTIPPAPAPPRPENPVLIPYKANAAAADLADPVRCASRLLIDGAFNVNSTDKNAWKAFLASTRHFRHPADATPAAGAAFPRSLEQPTAAATPPTGTDDDSFSGFRRLTDEELDALAEEIVRQVRLRGPFLSLSHFVNRALADIARQPALTRSGALQSAIDESGININLAGNRKAFSRINATQDRVTLAWKENAPRADLDGTDRDSRPPDADSSNPDWAVTSIDNNFGAVASIIADRQMLKEAKFRPEQGYRSTGIPGWLTQADVLQVIGPALAARSDTFRVRAYGEALGAAGNPVAKAWCEAIVQRIPTYVDPANPPHARGSELTAANTSHGRQFKVVSFRWLAPNEV